MASAAEAAGVPPPVTAEGIGRPLLLNAHVRDFLATFPKRDWPKAIEYVTLYGIRSLFSTYTPGSIGTLADLESVTAGARRDLASLSPLRRPRKPPTEQQMVALASSPRPTAALTDSRKPRPDALYHFPFVDEQGTVEEVLTDGQQWSFFGLDSREQERISKKVFDEIKTGVCGLSLDDLPYALRCVGIGLTDNQVHRLFPRLYARPDKDQPGRLERPVSFSQWLVILDALRTALQPDGAKPRQEPEGVMGILPSDLGPLPSEPPPRYDQLFEKSIQTEAAPEEEEDEPLPPQAESPLPPPPPRAAVGTNKTSKKATKQRGPSTAGVAAPAPQQARKRSAGTTARQASDKPAMPRSLRHVQSKIKPELDARREHLRKVRDARDEAIYESLAESRLKKLDPEYATYKEQLRKAAAAGRRPHSASPRLQSSRGRGATAREIAEAFLDSPLMSQLSEDAEAGSTSFASSPGRTSSMGARGGAPMRGGDADLSTFDLNRFVQDTTARESRGESGGAAGGAASSSRPRRYEQWLGDYGPPHTRTVRQTGAGDEDEEEEEEKEHDLSRSAAYSRHVAETFRKKQAELKDITRRVKERMQSGRPADSISSGGARSIDVEPRSSGSSSDSDSSSSSVPSSSAGEASSSFSALGGAALDVLSVSEKSVKL